MSVELNVEAKVVGQKRPLFTDWRIELPPPDDDRGDHLKLRDLITAIVTQEVQAFQTRQEDRKLARVLSRTQIEQGAVQGKIDPAEHKLQQQVDLDDALGTALQAFEDGLYFVFVDEVQQTSLDGEVFLKTNSKVVFLRLTALAGG